MASAFSPSLLSSAGAISSALASVAAANNAAASAGGGGGGKVPKSAPDDMYGSHLSQSSFSSLNSMSNTITSGSGIKSGTPNLLLNSNSQMHSPTSPIGSPYESNSGGGGGDRGDRSFESMLQSNGANGARKKQLQSTSDIFEKVVERFKGYFRRF